MVGRVGVKLLLGRGLRSKAADGRGKGKEKEKKTRERNFRGTKQTNCQANVTVLVSLNLMPWRGLEWVAVQTLPACKQGPLQLAASKANSLLRVKVFLD